MSRYHDDSTAASDPGGISLSTKKLDRFRNQLSRLLRRHIDEYFPPDMLHEHLTLGDSRAAVVLVTGDKLIVAAYTDELDCVALLEFPHELVKQYGLVPGSRLLTVNTYARGQVVAPDLENGSGSYHRYNNFYPIIAEFLSDDMSVIEARKASISESEWTRTTDMGETKLRACDGVFRDGSPYQSKTPARKETQHGTTQTSSRTGARPETPPQSAAHPKHGAHPQFGAHLFHCPRLKWPPPLASFAGGFIAILSAAFFISILIGDDIRTMIPSAVGATCGLPLGLFLLFRGYRDLPVFDFYEFGFVVSGSQDLSCPYRLVGKVELRPTHLYIQHLIPSGTIHRICMEVQTATSESEPLDCSLFSFDRTCVVFEQLADRISRHSGAADSPVVD